MTDDAPWVVLTRRTGFPKLTWIVRSLNDLGIENRFNGKSFHAPILEVREDCRERADMILSPIDDLEDEDSAFSNEHLAWWVKEQWRHDPAAGDLAGAIRVCADTLLTALEDQSQGGDLGLATGSLKRLSAFLAGLERVLPNMGGDSKGLLAQEVFSAMQIPYGAEGVVAAFMVLSEWLTLNMLQGLPGYVNDLEGMAADVKRELTKTEDGTVVPLRATISFDDAVKHGFEPDSN